MGLVHNGLGTHWDWGAMHLGHDGTGIQCGWDWETEQDWDTMWLGHNRPGTQWAWYTMGLDHNGPNTQRELVS